MLLYTSLNYGHSEGLWQSSKDVSPELLDFIGLRMALAPLTLPLHLVLFGYSSIWEANLTELD
jgi:hypothetical protein